MTAPGSQLIVTPKIDTMNFAANWRGMLDWFLETGIKYRLAGPGFSFAFTNANDALLFKLRWGEG